MDGNNQGENALHIAIVNENLELARELLTKAKGDDLANLLGNPFA